MSKNPEPMVAFWIFCLWLCAMVAVYGAIIALEGLYKLLSILL
jgi:hypothetical protein